MPFKAPDSLYNINAPEDRSGQIPQFDSDRFDPSKPIYY